MGTFPSFPDFFEALWGCTPFPWQTMLAERIVAGQWPRALDLPTAAGKTACIDAAIYALACQADKAIGERTAPRRIWFVVDRRIVVDEAFERAAKIADKLAEANDRPLQEVGARLLRLSGTNRPLAVARLRGGILRDDNWGRLPCQPAVITSTVDQIGSRLLFRGYGRSNLTASIFAGLAAHDSLILLDEAHCSVPFMQTLRAVETFRGKVWAESPIPTPFTFAILSATPPSEIPKDAMFPGAYRDRALDHPILRTRMSGPKPAELIMVKAHGRGDDLLIREAVKRARAYIDQHGKRRVAVIVNRVHTALEIAKALSTECLESADVVLLTGRMRPYEHDRMLEKWKPFLKARSPKLPGKPIILVSTQCIEVGADFSFEALVTEAASLDALRQRFGRLNRMGCPDEAPAAILIRDRDAEEGQTDPIYGMAIAHCWRLLDGKATSVAGKDGRRIVDFGISAVDRMLADVDDLSPYLSMQPDAPVLLPAHLELLCQTAPASAVEPDIGLFLHGKRQSPREARVVWRADLAADNPQIWKEIVALCPPVSGEMLTVPLYRLRAWLANGTAADEGTADVEGVGDTAIGNNEHAGESSRLFFIWRGRDRSEVVNLPQEIRPNDVIIVPAAYGVSGIGQSAPAENLGEAGLDLWEPSWTASGKPPALRLHREILAGWLDIPPVKDLIELCEDSAREREDLREAVDTLVAYQPDDEDQPARPPQWLLDLLKAVRNGRIEDHPGGGVVLFAKKSASDRDDEPDLFADDDDLASCWIPRERSDHREVTLEDHSAWVERAVEQIASRCLPDKFVGPLRRAALWHDVGKLDERFQLLLRHGNEIGNDPARPLAKSAFVPVSPGRREAIRAAAGMPKGFRHELLSFQLAERYAALPAGQDDTDLTLHLVASHHGHARPFAPVVLDLEPPPVFGQHDGVAIALDTADRKALIEPHNMASGVADRFWALSRRYGWWGLAYLEAVLRLADWYGSEHVVQEKLSEAATHQRSRTEIGVPAPTDAVTLVLTGLDGANPLGFLSALGTLVVLRQGVCPRARLGWTSTVTWQPVLAGIPQQSKETLCDAIAARLRGQLVSDEAERKRTEAQHNFDAAKTALKKKWDEIKKREWNLRDKERRAAIEAEVAPLKRDARCMRETWREALKHAVASPELALGQRIDCTSDEYREFAATFLESGETSERAALNLLAAFASDICLEEADRIATTPFCFITGSGHQYFLDTVRQLVNKVSPERVHSALFEPWTYEDEKLSLRWDPMEDRRYALMDCDPTASGNEPRTVWMANLLGYRALALLPSAPGRRGLETTGWSGPGNYFTWPVWYYPVEPDTIRSLMLLSDLGADVPRRPFLRHRGVAAVFRSPRVRVGTRRNFKINFGPGRGV